MEFRHPLLYSQGRNFLRGATPHLLLLLGSETLCLSDTSTFRARKFVTQTQRDDAFGARWATQMYKILRIVQFL